MSVSVLLLITLGSSGQPTKGKDVYRTQLNINREVRTLLGNMGAIPYSECEDNWRFFRLSEFLKNMSEVPIGLLQITIHQFSVIFTDNLANSVENKTVTQAMSKMQTLLYWYSTSGDYSGLKELTLKYETKKIRRYFRKMLKYLMKKGYSRCAWASVRDEMEKVLLLVTWHTDILLKKHLQRGHPKAIV
uniref:Type I interferon 1 n=1 Tax=Xenopus tropicalis TaxID=8364 RepID=A8E6F3_XENTR|nr:type I interferon 1 [Xenopus tropicalis]CAO03085.1 TPA: type I interferon 1 [Xenopus tropicalis]